jgi:hypothetical protein
VSGGIGLVVCFGVVGSATLIAGLSTLHKLRVSRNWPQGAGTITKAKLVTEPDEDGTTYSITVSYDYIVDGVRHTGKRIGFAGVCFGRKEEAEAAVQRYPVNANVPVYYDPESPADAVLSRESPGFMLFLAIAFGIVMLGAAVWCLLFGSPE